MAKFLVFLALALCGVFAKPPVHQDDIPVMDNIEPNLGSRIRDDYTETFGKSWYKYHRSPRTFARAQLACQAEGAHLAIINSAPEANFLVSLMNRNPPLADVERKDYVLVGFHDAFENDVYLTIDGRSLERSGYTTFGVHEPTGDGRCGSLHRDATLNDFPCNVRSPFICEYTPWQQEGNVESRMAAPAAKVSESSEQTEA